MTPSEFVPIAERYWDDLFTAIRGGNFDSNSADQFCEDLDQVQVGLDSMIDRDFVRLVWFLPIFLESQINRVREKGHDGVCYDSFINKVTNILHRLLGVP